MKPEIKCLIKETTGKEPEIKKGEKCYMNCPEAFKCSVFNQESTNETKR